jgi:hypothetical protein
MTMECQQKTCELVPWWNCSKRGCYEQAKERYADVMIDRTFELRPEHDMNRDGTVAKPGK